VSSENERDLQADDGEGEGEEGAPVAASEPAALDRSAPRNRAERRAVAKAARRGQQPVLADAAAAADDAPTLDPDANLVAPTTSMGGNPVAIPDMGVGQKRPKVPPRTMSKGTGDVEGVPDWVRRAGEGFSARRNTVVTGVLLFCAVVGGVWAVQAMRTRKAAEAGEALTQALDAFSATAQRTDGAEAPRFGPTFGTDDERLREAATRFRRAGERFPDARVAPMAQLGQATTLYLQGRYAEARPIYQGLLGKDLAGLEAQALEGLGFTLESLNDLDGALQRFRELQALQDGAYRDQAQFYQARVFVRRNEPDRAKELLRQIVERIGTAAAADPSAVASLSLRDQAFALLREVAPTDPLILQRDRERAVGRPEGDNHEGEGGGTGGIPPELLRQLQERMRRTKQGG
jgi:tetratricopeptide (TPR) repeat protein